MSSPDQGTTTGPTTRPVTGLEAISRDALAEAERILDGGGSIEDVPDEAIQRLLLAAVRLFSAKRDSGERLEAFPANSVTATDVAVTCVAMTEAVNLELFELALWHGWSNI